MSDDDLIPDDPPEPEHVSGALIAGTEAGRLVHLYQSVREELGLV